MGKIIYGILNKDKDTIFCFGKICHSTEGVILGYNSLMGNETPQWMKDDLQGGIETFGNVILNTLGNAFGLVTMIPEVNNLINDLDNSTRDSSIMGAILHDVRHAKDLKQKPIHDKFNKAAQFSGYESGHAAGEIVSEIVSWIGPAKLFKMAGGSKLVSRLAQMPKIQKGISYFRKARTALANSHLGMLARESYGATKNFFTSRFGNLWDDFSRTKFAFAGLDDFRYADDIGKHTARLYQSTSEGAEYQRLRRALYSEAAEQSGRKVSREFRKEASEQLARHSDDVAKGAKEAAEQVGKKARQDFSKEASEQLAKQSDDLAKGAKDATRQDLTDQFVESSFNGNLIKEYVKDVKLNTNRNIPNNQIEELKNALRLREYEKLSPVEVAKHRAEFNRLKNSLIDEWELKTGQTWPTYSEDVIGKNGNVVRKAGSKYDAHHIIENSYGGNNEWWNIHPARFPNEHQAGIHRAGSPARELFN